MLLGQQTMTAVLPHVPTEQTSATLDVWSLSEGKTAPPYSAARAAVTSRGRKMQ
jgi:hypothetical protein